MATIGKRVHDVDLLQNFAFDISYSRESRLVDASDRPDFQLLLNRTGNRHCTDPRDKIYCILPLLDRFNIAAEPALLQLDYAKPVQQVVCEAMATMIRAANDLAVIFRLFSTWRDRGTGWASWIPDLTAPEPQRRFSRQGITLIGVSVFNNHASSSHPNPTLRILAYKVHGLLGTYACRLLVDTHFARRS